MCKLLNKTRELLRASHLPLERVAVDTEISYSLLSKLHAPGTCSIPGVDKVERLYEYLSGKQLEV